MGLITATIRKTQLNNYRLDLEYKMGLISASKLNLSQTVNDLLSVASDLDTDSPEAKALEKKSEITEDDLKNEEEQIQKLTDKKVQEIDSLLEAKEKEIMTI